MIILRLLFNKILAPFNHYPRLIFILITIRRYALIEVFDYNLGFFIVFWDFILIIFPRKYKKLAIEVRVRLALEHLGPVFIKFGQLLSTRQDLLTEKYLLEFSKLQSQVTPFASDISRKLIEQGLNKKIAELFSEFSPDPVASASIAQVHKARLRSNNQLVAVKVLRPNITQTIIKDIKLLKLAAKLIILGAKDAKRLKPEELITEFERTIHNELDFLQEAANATELARLHYGDHRIIIPKIYYDYCSSTVIVLEWKDGIVISDINNLKQQGIDLIKLSIYGVEIFYTQVFKFGFFHADMHPGNILCSAEGKYIALDFGIVGSLSEEDKRYLAINILAFFNRDYKKVAKTHIESGWAPLNTSVEELESAIRAVCEPIFAKPLAEISFGQILIKLFQVSRKFNITVQPQLLLLQKTIINVEGLGRMLNPQLDLWLSAKPILSKWMKEQMGLKGLINNFRTELSYLSYTLPKLPRLYLESTLSKNQSNQMHDKYLNLLHKQQKINYLLLIAIIILIFIKLPL